MQFVCDHEIQLRDRNELHDHDEVLAGRTNRWASGSGRPGHAATTGREITTGGRWGVVHAG
jgi:hypothetical protein